ncbi:DUF4304 domain-containing protein [Mucilaginibacter terrae]|uniref:DUF4304 domain-containing protein n=1 Tax=Mucilaginibacter terrae TaxID=1955052 RepID=UPI0036338FB9
MKKDDLARILDDILIPFAFKRKGNNWLFNGNELTKIINLQKSNFSNTFYINYGYIIRGLELTTKMHVEDRLASGDKMEQQIITGLLDLEIEMPADQRLLGIKRLITNKVLMKVTSPRCRKGLPCGYC